MMWLEEYSKGDIVNLKSFDFEKAYIQKHKSLGGANIIFSKLRELIGYEYCIIFFNNYSATIINKNSNWFVYTYKTDTQMHIQEYWFVFENEEDWFTCKMLG